MFSHLHHADSSTGPPHRPLLPVFVLWMNAETAAEDCGDIPTPEVNGSSSKLRMATTPKDMPLTDAPKAALSAD